MTIPGADPYDFDSSLYPNTSRESNENHSSAQIDVPYCDFLRSVDSETVRSHFPWFEVSEGTHVIDITSIAHQWIQHHPHRELVNLSHLLTYNDVARSLKGSEELKNWCYLESAYPAALSLSELKERAQINQKSSEELIGSLIRTTLFKDPSFAQRAQLLARSATDSPTVSGDKGEDCLPPENQLAPLPDAATIVLAIAQLENTLNPIYDNDPTFVISAKQEIFSFNPAARLREHAIKEIELLFGGDVDRVGTVIHDRSLSVLRDGKICTLEEIGNKFGITRERVRQLEKNAKKQLIAEAEVLTFLTDYFSRKYGPLFKIADIDAFWLAPVGPLDLSLAELSLFLSEESFERKHGWIFPKGFSTSLLSIFHKKELQTFGMLSHDTLCQHIETLSHGDFSIDNALRLIEDTNEYVSEHGYWHPKGQNVQTIAAQFLFFENAPVSHEELVQRMPERSAVSIANALGAHEWFKRVGKSSWALADWDMEEWRGLYDYICTQIIRNGGRAKISEIRQGAESFGVATSSINSYIGSPDFVRDGDYLSIGDGSATNDSTPEEYSNMIWKDGMWNLLLTVNSDHLRGSGFGIPRGIIEIYDLSYNKPFTIPSRAGQVEASTTLRWGRTNLSLSSIRWAVEALGSQEGDRLWLRFGESVDFYQAPPENPLLEGTAALLNHFGLEEDPALSALQQINAALGLDKDGPLRKTVQRLYHRREDDIAEEIRRLVN